VTGKTIIVDDHPVVRFGVKQRLTSADNIEVGAEMDDVDNLIQVLIDTGADIVLLDLELEHTHGVDALRLVRENAPDTKVIIYTSHDEEDRIVQAAELGVDGYLLKGCGQNELVSAMETVSGRRHCHPSHGGRKTYEPHEPAILGRRCPDRALQ